jgi:dTDP-4-amino-4,6-dideoxygalactose transaminase
MIPAAKPNIGADEREAVDRVMRSGMIAQGPEVAAFETEFSAALAPGRACVAVSSGTSGLHLGLIAVGVGPGDEVIVPSFTFAATGNSVALAGATPVFADIDPRTFCLDPASVVAAITPKTRAILVVHLYGQAADMDALVKIASKHGIMLLEDAAQAHGAKFNDEFVGTFGDFAMFSLYPTKNMTSGEGGMVSCLTSETERTMRLLRNQGMERRYENEVIGFNQRMTDIHAAIGRVQLAKLPAWTAKRQSNAALFNAELEGVVTPFTAPQAEHVWHQYTIRVEGDRDGFAKALADEHGVGSGVYYPIPNHDLPSLKTDADVPNTYAACAEVLSLPVYPTLTDGELAHIVQAVNSVAKAGA